MLIACPKKMDHFSLPDDELNIRLSIMSYTISLPEFTDMNPRSPSFFDNSFFTFLRVVIFP
jgi:hypothetical protein